MCLFSLVRSVATILDMDVLVEFSDKADDSERITLLRYAQANVDLNWKYFTCGWLR